MKGVTNKVPDFPEWRSPDSRDVMNKLERVMLVLERQERLLERIADKLDGGIAIRMG